MPLQRRDALCRRRTCQVIGGANTTTSVETARTARAALKKTLPESKISVTSTCNIPVRWTDDGPTVEEVQAVILATGCAEAKRARDGKIWLSANNLSFWLDC